MAKVIHCADLHLGSSLSGSIHSESDHDSRPDEVFASFRKLVDYAIHESVDLVLIAGDIFDKNWPNYATVALFEGELKRLQEHNIHVVGLYGNHDAAAIRNNFTYPENFTLLTSEQADTIDFPDLQVAIHGQSFANQHVQDDLAAAYPEPLSDRFNIGLLHTSLEGTSSRHIAYAPTTKSVLASKRYDYWALGHIHIPEIISEDPYIVYAGNIQGRHIHEAGPRGFYLLDIIDAKLADPPQFIATADRTWAQLEVSLSDCSGPDDIPHAVLRAIEQYLEEHPGNKALRLNLIGAVPFHKDLEWRREHLEQNILQELNHSDDDIYLNRIRWNLTPQQSWGNLLRANPMLQKVSDALENHPTELMNSIAQELEPLKKKLKTQLPSQAQVSFEHLDALRAEQEEAQRILHNIFAGGTYED